MADQTPLIDSHCHLNLEQYDKDREKVVKSAERAGVTRILIPSVDVGTSKSALALADTYDNITVGVGVHPNSTGDFTHETLQTIAELSHNEHVVSIGEIGLDYHWDTVPPEKQKVAFEKQLELATERELPVIIHNREASDDVIAILESWATTLPESLKDRAGVLHSFSAPLEIAERALEIGFYLGFSGPITYKNADSLRRVAVQMPLDRILVETDGPYLTPEPHRGKRNSPAYIPFIADRLAALHQTTLEEIAQHTTANAERLFKIPPVA
ncbi:MAG: TatD family hydrolase [Chloroflexota bacterium]